MNKKQLMVQEVIKILKNEEKTYICTALKLAGFRLNDNATADRIANYVARCLNRDPNGVKRKVPIRINEYTVVNWLRDFGFIKQDAEVCYGAMKAYRIAWLEHMRDKVFAG